MFGARVLDDLQTDDIALDDVLDYRGRYDSFNGALVGMKPPEFAVWMFAQLGARPGDTLDDLYPGSGAVGRAWALYASLEDAVRAPEPSRLESDDASRDAAAIRPGRQADVARERVPRRRGGPTRTHHQRSRPCLATPMTRRPTLPQAP